MKKLLVLALIIALLFIAVGAMPNVKEDIIPTPTSVLTPWVYLPIIYGGKPLPPSP